MGSATDPLRLRIAYVTCAENGLFGLRRLRALGHTLAVVVTIGPATARRFEVSGYVDVTPWCRAEGIPVVVLDDYVLRTNDLAAHAFDVLVVNGWNRLLKPEVIALAPLGGLGIHAGHPPIGLGRAPLVWNILKGHTDIEPYVFRLTERADDGAILSRRVVEITKHDDVDMLYQKVMFAGVDLFVEAIARLAAGEPGEAQDPGDTEAYPKRTPADGLIDFARSEDEIHDFIRAQSRPYPGAFTYLDDRLWRIWRAVPFDRFAFRDQVRAPGRIVAALPGGLVVQTGGGTLWLREADEDDSPVIPGPAEPLERLVGKRFRPRPATNTGAN
jgi:methionyl-tRNA formyltransferase